MRRRAPRSGLIWRPFGAGDEPRLNKPAPDPLLLSPDEDGGGVPKANGVDAPLLVAPSPAPNVNDGAGGMFAPAPNENDVVGVLLPLFCGAGAPNVKAPLGGALPNVKDVVGAGAVGAPNEKDVVDAGGVPEPNIGAVDAGVVGAAFCMGAPNENVVVDACCPLGVPNEKDVEGTEAPDANPSSFLPNENDVDELNDGACGADDVPLNENAG